MAINKFLPVEKGSVPFLFYKTPEGLRWFASYSNPMIKKMNKSNCDLIIFPSQERASFQTVKKALSTIHDLMHRYESHFKEYQNGMYIMRENHYQMISKYSEAILVDSEIGKQHVLESYGVIDEKVFVLPFVPPLYLKDAVAVDVLKKYKLPRKYFFYPAQFWEHKNHVNLLEAMKILRDDYKEEINMVFVGSKKNNYNNVLERIKQLELSANIYILGYVSNNDMASLYKNAIATTFVSLIGPTNIPPIEAMALGCPLICSNAYAMPEQAGEAAFFVDPNNPHDIAEKIKELILNNELVQQKVAMGYKKIAEYGQEDFSNRLASYIECLLKR